MSHTQENTVGFFKSTDYNGGRDAYDGTLAVPGGLHGIESIQMWNGKSYLVIYDKDNYGGHYLKLENSVKNLKDIKRGSDGGDWKHQVQSFIMYEKKPGFWDNGAPYSSIAVDADQVLFCIDTNFSNANTIAKLPRNEPDLNKVQYEHNTGSMSDMKNNIESIKTGSSAWVVVYDETDYKGNQWKIYPGKSYPDLGIIDRGDNGDWKNQIQSFQSFNQKPVWDLSFNKSKFTGLFAGSRSYNGQDNLTYTTQGADYKIFFPLISYPDALTMRLELRIEYVVNALSHNDKVYLTVDFNGTGGIIAATYSYDAGSALQVPEKLVTAVDKGAKLLGILGTLETAGISDEAAEAFVETFDTAVKIFDDISNLAYKIMANDDGRFYLMPVIAHTVARLSLSIQ